MSTATPAPSPTPSTHAPVISDWQEINKNTLIGAFTVTLPSGMQIVGCMVHRNKPGGSEWVSLPAAAQIERDGMARRANDGKILYKTIIKFRNRDVGDRFQAMILEELARLGHI